MNLFQLVAKNMRQRSLSTWLTLLSVLLGVGLAIAIMVLGRETDAIFGQKSFGFDALIGQKGQPLQLTLNTIYHIEDSPGNIEQKTYSRLISGDLRNYAKIVVPTVVGDTYQGKYRIVGTLPKLFGFDDDTGTKPIPADQILEYRPGEYGASGDHYEIDQGRVFAPNKFEAVIGSDLAKLTDLKIGKTFQATHGVPKPNEIPDIHDEVWTVVGTLKPTHTAADRVVFIALNSFYTIAEHGVGLIVQDQLKQGLGLDSSGQADVKDVVTVDPDGTQHHANYNLTTDGVIHLHSDLLEKLALSAILVKTPSPVAFQQLQYILKNDGKELMACNPASVMREFFDTFLKPSKSVLLAICSLVTVVAAVGILVSIYNSVSARTREIAILRALGATRGRILAIISTEAGMIAALGGLAGLLVGHLVAGAGSHYMWENFGTSLHWLTVDPYEIAYYFAVIALALIAGLVPALKAYQTPVATNLTTG